MLLVIDDNSNFQFSEEVLTDTFSNSLFKSAYVAINFTHYILSTQLTDTIYSERSIITGAFWSVLFQNTHVRAFDAFTFISNIVPLHALMSDREGVGIEDLVHKSLAVLGSVEAAAAHTESVSDEEVDMVFEYGQPVRSLQMRMIREDLFPVK